MERFFFSCDEEFFIDEAYALVKINENKFGLVDLQCDKEVEEKSLDFSMREVEKSSSTKIGVFSKTKWRKSLNLYLKILHLMRQLSQSTSEKDSTQ